MKSIKIKKKQNKKKNIGDNLSRIIDRKRTIEATEKHLVHPKIYSANTKQKTGTNKNKSYLVKDL